MSGGTSSKSAPSGSGFARLIKLLIFAGGIYAAFLQYGAAQEDIYKCPKDNKNCEKIDVWFVNCCEAIANVVVGGVALMIVGNIPGYPIEYLSTSALFQQGAKGCTNLAMVYKMPFAITTLAKSGKMIPVMIGSIFIGGKKYSFAQIASVMAIVFGTVLVSMYSGGSSHGSSHVSSGSNKSNDLSQYIGIGFLAASLAFDGVVAGKQTELDNKCKEKKIPPSYSRAFAMMFWTNLFMSGIAFVAAIFSYQKTMDFLATHSETYELIGHLLTYSLIHSLSHSLMHLFTEHSNINKYKKYCVKCKAFKPSRAHHCSACRRCIIKMDHHCPWVNNCIGIGNHKYFLQFILW